LPLSTVFKHQYIIRSPNPSRLHRSRRQTEIPNLNQNELKILPESILIQIEIRNRLWNLRNEYYKSPQSICPLIHPDPFNFGPELPKNSKNHQKFIKTPNLPKLVPKHSHGPNEPFRIKRGRKRDENGKKWVYLKVDENDFYSDQNVRVDE
jgi:hypothetical protein